MRLLPGVSPLRFQWLRLFQGWALAPCTLCPNAASTVPSLLQDVGTFHPLSSAWQATFSPSLLPSQHGHLRYCSSLLSQSLHCFWSPGFCNGDSSTANDTPLVTLAYLHECHTCQKGLQGANCYTGTSGAAGGLAATGCSTSDHSVTRTSSSQLQPERCLLLSSFFGSDSS